MKKEICLFEDSYLLGSGGHGCETKPAFFCAYVCHGVLKSLLQCGILSCLREVTALCCPLGSRMLVPLLSVPLGSSVRCCRRSVFYIDDASLLAMAR